MCYVSYANRYFVRDMSLYIWYLYLPWALPRLAPAETIAVDSTWSSLNRRGNGVNCSFIPCATAVSLPETLGTLVETKDCVSHTLAKPDRLRSLKNDESNTFP